MVDRGYPSILLYSGRLNYSKIAPALGVPPVVGISAITLLFHSFFRREIRWR